MLLWSLFCTLLNRSLYICYIFQIAEKDSNIHAIPKRLRTYVICYVATIKNSLLAGWRVQDEE